MIESIEDSGIKFASKLSVEYLSDLEELFFSTLRKADTKADYLKLINYMDCLK